MQSIGLPSKAVFNDILSEAQRLISLSETNAEILGLADEVVEAIMTVEDNNSAACLLRKFMSSLEGMSKSEQFRAHISLMHKIYDTPEGIFTMVGLVPVMIMALPYSAAYGVYVIAQFINAIGMGSSLLEGAGLGAEYLVDGPLLEACSN